MTKNTRGVNTVWLDGVEFFQGDYSPYRWLDKPLNTAIFSDRASLTGGRQTSHVGSLAGDRE